MIHIVPGDPVSKCWARERPQGSSLNCVMHWDWIYRCARGMDTTCGTSATAILGDPSSFKRRCAKLSLNVTLRRFKLHSSHWLFARRMPSLRECSPPIAAVKPPTALSERVLVQNDW